MHPVQSLYALLALPGMMDLERNRVTVLRNSLQRRRCAATARAHAWADGWMDTEHSKKHEAAAAAAAGGMELQKNKRAMAQ